MMRLCTISHELLRWHLSGVDVQLAIDVSNVVDIGHKVGVTRDFAAARNRLDNVNVGPQ